MMMKFNFPWWFKLIFWVRLMWRHILAVIAGGGLVWLLLALL